MNYPEHEKMKAVGDERRNEIAQFLEWIIYENNWSLCHYLKAGEDGAEESGMYIAENRIENIMARYFGIDLDVLELEKQVMLGSQRRWNDDLPKTPSEDPEWEDFPAPKEVVDYLGCLYRTQEEWRAEQEKAVSKLRRGEKLKLAGRIEQKTKYPDQMPFVKLPREGNPGSEKRSTLYARFCVLRNGFCYLLPEGFSTESPIRFRFQNHGEINRHLEIISPAKLEEEINLQAAA